MTTQPTIAFIGAGNMASSLMGGLIADGYPASKIVATDPSQEKLNELTDRFGIQTTTQNLEAAKQADVILFAVKPAVLKSVILELKDILTSDYPLLISVVTGIKTDTMCRWAESSALPIVRTMPNTPALLGCGTTGLFANAQVNEDQRAIAESIMRAVGLTMWFEAEKDLDTVTAVSGSGPAYFFLIMECMRDCGQAMGLSREQAELLTVNTALGAARMALETGEDVAALREQVTSKGGTTEQAILAFEKGGIRQLVEEALTAARDKAIAMADTYR